jgi:uncharacterized protein (UPF0332 family)
MALKRQVTLVAGKNSGNYMSIQGLISKNLGKHCSELFEKRQKGDYNDFFDFDEETVLRLYQPSVDFINEISKLIMK